MKSSINERCWTCGDDVTVYQILPENRWNMEKMDGKAMGEWVFETLEPRASDRSGAFKTLGYGIVVAGKNFGCGNKSVEHPMAALKGAGVKLIIAESVSRYSYRNAINLALPVILCEGITQKIHTDDEVSVDLRSGIIMNHTAGETIYAAGLDKFAASVMLAGGLLQYIEREINAQHE